MTPADIRQSVLLEVEAGQEALRAARALVAEGLHRSAMSRAYYAMFHHVKALLYGQGFEPKSHEGLERLFGLHFVRPGRVDPSSAKLLARLRKYREESDYGLVSVFTRQDVEQELAEIERFLQAIRTHLAVGEG